MPPLHVRRPDGQAPTALMKVPLLTTFEDLGLSDRIRTALVTEGYTEPTPIQAQAIPHVLGGGDILAVIE